MSVITVTAPFNDPRHLHVVIDGKRYSVLLSQMSPRMSTILALTKSPKFGRHWRRVSTSPLRERVLLAAAEYLTTSPKIDASEQSLWAGFAFSLLAKESA